MTYNEIINIASRLDKETKKKIDKEVEERLEILKLGELDQEDIERMEECLYMSLVIQEYLDGEYELIEEERQFLLSEMEELYGDYNDLLLKAKLEEKVGKKKRMALELMKIREQLFNYKDRMKGVKENLKENRNNKEKLEELSSKDTMKEVAKENKEFAKENKREKFVDDDMKNRENKFGLDFDSGSVLEKVSKIKHNKEENVKEVVIEKVVIKENERHAREKEKDFKELEGTRNSSVWDNIEQQQNQMENVKGDSIPTNSPFYNVAKENASNSR